MTLSPDDYNVLNAAIADLRAWDAREKARELEQLNARRAAGLPEAVRVSALLATFEEHELPGLAPGTQRSYRDSLKPIRAYFVGQLGDPLVTAVHAKHVAGSLTWRRAHRIAGAEGSSVSSRTVQKDRTVLHRIFGLAERLEVRDGNPVARTTPPKADARDPVLLTDAEYGRLLAQCAGRPMFALYVLTLGETGARCESEALWLRWEDVDLEQGFLWIASGAAHRTKSGKGRWVPMTPKLVAAYRAHFAAYRFAGSPWVFHHLTTGRRHVAGERIHSLRTAFAGAAARAKLPAGLHQHDLRHRRVTAWLAEGKNPVHVKEAVGHSDPRTTMAYTHLSREHLRSLVDATAAGERPAGRPARRRR